MGSAGQVADDGQLVVAEDDGDPALAVLVVLASDVGLPAVLVLDVVVAVVDRVHVVAAVQQRDTDRVAVLVLLDGVLDDTQNDRCHEAEDAQHGRDGDVGVVDQVGVQDDRDDDQDDARDDADDNAGDQHESP